MFAFNDIGLIDESLAFHVSTNTFSNPAFDQDHIEFASYDGTTIDRQQPPPSSSRNHREHQEAGESQEGSKKKKTTTKRKSSSFKSSFGDSIAFAIRSKLFVIDSNFKRKFESLKSFAIRYFPAIFESRKRPTVAAATRSTSNINKNKVHDCGSDQFWNNIVEPNSRKSLGKQKEKILNRLERALEHKRRKQVTTSNNANSLRHIRPGILGHPLYTEYIPTYAPTAASASAATTTTDTAASPIGGDAGPLLIGSLQHWARRQPKKSGGSSSNNNSSKIRQNGGRGSSGSASNSSKWRQIRDIVFDDGNVDDDGDASELNSKKLCIVCYTNTPNIVTLPCKHHDVCSDCFIEMIYIAVKKSQYPLKCALCRQKVEKIRCSRKLLLSVIEKQRIYP